MVQLSLIERSGMRRPLRLFSQSLSVRDHEWANRADYDKAERLTHDEGIKKVVERARNDVPFETWVHHHHVRIKSAYRLGQTCY